MPKPRAVAIALLAVIVLSSLPTSLRATAPLGSPPDPLEAEIEQWSRRLAAEASADPLWTDVKEGAGPVLTRAQEALKADRRLLALLRLAAARENLAAGAWMLERPPAVRKEIAAFEGEWARMGETLSPSLRSPSAEELQGVRPALARALAEAARHQVRVYYDASLEYGRSTTPDSGLFYLGAAQAQAEFVGLSRTLAATQPPDPRGEPKTLRSLGPELDALEREMLSAYRPPASVDRHPQFIAASAALKTARELDGAGLRHGALLRYLQAILRFAAVKEPASGSSSSAVALDPAFARTREESVQRLAGADHSLGRVFLELADAELASDPAAGAATATAVVNEVLPRYFAALAPATAVVPGPEPRATVTLVRWPYT